MAYARRTKMWSIILAFIILPMSMSSLPAQDDNEEFEPQHVTGNGTILSRTPGLDSSGNSVVAQSDPGPDNLDEALAEGMRSGAGLGNEDAAYRRGLNDGRADGFQDGFNAGKNEGFLDTHGSLTGETPGPVIIPETNRHDLGLPLEAGGSGVGCTNDLRGCLSPNLVGSEFDRGEGVD